MKIDDVVSRKGNHMIRRPCREEREEDVHCIDTGALGFRKFTSCYRRGTRIEVKSDL